jgi:uncharacterized protein HemX
LDLKFKQPKLIDATIDLIRLASSVEIRSAVNRILTILKDLPGYDYSAHSIRADINWSMVRGAKPRGD